MADGRDVPNREVLDEIGRRFGVDAGVTTGTMFRSPGLRVHGRVFAFLGSRGELIVKLPRARAAQLVADGTAGPVVMGPRTMREWVQLGAREDRTSTLSLWSPLADEAHLFVGGSSTSA